MSQQNGSQLQSSEVAAWAQRGVVRRLAGHDVFTVEVAAVGPETEPPLLVVHGFPTSSYDFAGVVDALAVGRRVLLCDYVGFGLSSKPDVASTLALHADVVAAFVSELGLDEVTLLSHDLGDTVGGELLARTLDGTWPVKVVARVLTNGSIYIDLAQLTFGQQYLLSLPDERAAADAAPDAAGLAASLLATLSPATTLGLDDLAPHGELVASGGGARLLPRTIRYIEERRRNESRFTGAIEAHPSPLSVVWGADDPIAVLAMTDRLRERRPDLTLTVLDGVGHYPMLEAPGPFTAAVLDGLAHRS